MRDLILVLKIGETSTEVLALDPKLAVVGHASSTLAFKCSEPDAQELEVERWRRDLDVLAAKVVQAQGLERFAGLALVGSGSIVLAWDRATGEPLGPALGPSDGRGRDLCESLRENRKAPMLHFRTGLFLDVALPANRLAWLLLQRPGLKARALRGEIGLGSLETWLLQSLTRDRGMVVEPGLASRTGLYDLSTSQWEPQLLAAFGIPAITLPQLRPSLGPMGDCAAEWAPQLPILALLCESGAALFAQDAWEPETLRIHYGDRLQLHLSLGLEPRVENHLLAGVAWALDGETHYLLSADPLTGGAVVRWLRDEMGLLTDPQQAETLARQVPDAAGLFFIPALSGLGAPYFDDFARGALLGLTPRVTKPHLVRAVLEGLAHQAADVAQVLAKAGQQQLHRVRADGPWAANGFLLQTQADWMGLPVERAATLDAAAVGAAAMGGWALGWWRDREHLRSVLAWTDTFVPQLSPEQREPLRQRWLDALERVQGWDTLPADPQ